MPRIATFTAPEKKLRPSATGTSAFELEGRRIGPLYQDIARNAREQGQLDVQKYKELLWPRDIVKLYEDRAKRATSGGVNVRTIEPTTTTDHMGHAQVSRGARALGSALSDGGYALSDTGPGTSTDIDTSTGLPVQKQDLSYLSKSQKAWADYNGIGVSGGGQGSYLGTVADKAAGELDSYWRNYGQPGIPTGPVDSSGNPTGIDQYGNPTGAGGFNADGSTTSSGGFWSGLSDYVSSLSGDQSSTTDTGM